MIGKRPKNNFKACIKIECHASSLSVNIKSEFSVVPVKMAKIILALDDILSQFYHKEWIQDDLRNLGISSTGNKEDLVYRLLNSFRIRNQSVQDSGENLISALPATELKALARYIGIAANGSRSEVLSRIIDSVNFEAYVEPIDRMCHICVEKTPQEIHYDDHWRQLNFECTVCGNKTYLEKLHNQYFTKVDDSGESKTPDMTEDKAASGTLISISIAIFLSLLFGLEVYIPWFLSLLIASLAFVVSLLILAFTKPYWEKYIAILIQKFSKSQ